MRYEPAMPDAQWILYGANGYTGELIARQAAAAGLRPILAGRSHAKVAALARELGLEHRVFGLDEAAAVDRGLAGAALVVHAAGPFSQTSPPMLAGCLRQGVHYLDITGEITVFEACRAQDGAARERGIVVLPGVGFDVVPSDCLAKALAEALPEATRLELAILTRGEISRGTAKTMVEGLGKGSTVRRAGRLEEIAAGSLVREVPFSGGARLAVAIPWGDLSTAYASTKIPDIVTYMSFPRKQIRAMRLLGPLAPLLRRRAVVRLLQKLIERRLTGPSEHVREAGSAEVWGRVEAAFGNAVEGRAQTPEGYTFTAIAALASAKRVLAGEVSPGYHTPSTAFGSDFLRALPGCSMQVPG